MENNPVAIKQHQITFSIKESKCIIFEFTSFAKINKIKIPFDKYRFDLQIKVNMDVKEKSVTLDVDAMLFANTDEIKEKLATLKSKHTFVILNFNELVVVQDGNPALPQEVIITLLAISVSNTRGMTSVKLEGSKYEQAIIPIVDVGRFFPAPKTTAG
jgi:hypothetical protein